MRYVMKVTCKCGRCKTNRQILGHVDQITKVARHRPLLSSLLYSVSGSMDPTYMCVKNFAAWRYGSRGSTTLLQRSSVAATAASATARSCAGR
jgi:hypothetical protein